MHIDFPFRVDERRRTAQTPDENYIRDLIEQVLFTAPGERVNRPTFGSGVLQLVFEPNGGELVTATELLVRGALQQWLAEEIEVLEVDVTSEDSLLQVTVLYRIRSAPQPQVAVFTRPV